MFTLKTSENSELHENGKKPITEPLKDTIVHILVHFLPVGLCESICLILLKSKLGYYIHFYFKLYLCATYHVIK